MGEHSFLAVMVGFVIIETLFGILLVGYFVSRMDRRTSAIDAKCELMHAAIAATFLTVQRALRRLR